MACAEVMLSAVAASIGIDIKDAIVRADGDIEFRETLGVSNVAPVGFKAIGLSFMLDCEATDEQIQTLAKPIVRYCIVYQTLVWGVLIETAFHKQ